MSIGKQYAKKLLTKREVTAICLFADSTTERSDKEIARAIKMRSNDLPVIKEALMNKLDAVSMSEAVSNWGKHPQNVKNIPVAARQELPVEAYKYAISTVWAIRYTGTEMDAELCKCYSDDLCIGFMYESPMLCTHRHGLRNPHSGDWLVFDSTGKTLIDVMEDGVFKQTFRKGEPGL